MNRRNFSFTLAVILPVVGLTMRSQAARLPAPVADYGPDILWALLVFALAALLAPRLSSERLALCALGFAYSMELSQLYHAPWIDGIRATRVGGLLLGSTFVWSDLVCYSFGIACGFLLDKTMSQASKKALHPQ